jgi:hypothetical protein
MIFGMVAKRFIYKKRKAAARRAAQVMHKSLHAWQNAGRTIVTLLEYLRGVKHVQRWWRNVRRLLQEQRDIISRRWLKLERERLRLEASKATSGRRAPAATIADDVRKKFIENELRARRYYLLPQIDLWLADQLSWRREVQEWNEMNEAYRLLDKSRTRLPLFRWPSARPSYMPSQHTSECDACCSKCCPGRKGDAEILDMFERARKDPTDWMKISIRAHNDDPRKTIKWNASDSMDAVFRISDVPGAGMFGPPPSTADMQKYGVAADFPGRLQP